MKQKFHAKYKYYLLYFKLSINLVETKSLIPVDPFAVIDILSGYSPFHDCIF